jgi:hypothetical protein
MPKNEDHKFVTKDLPENENWEQKKKKAKGKKKSK